MKSQHQFLLEIGLTEKQVRNWYKFQRTRWKTSLILMESRVANSPDGWGIYPKLKLNQHFFSDENKKLQQLASYTKYEVYTELVTLKSRLALVCPAEELLASSETEFKSILDGLDTHLDFPFEDYWESIAKIENNSHNIFLHLVLFYSEWQRNSKNEKAWFYGRRHWDLESQAKFTQFLLLLLQCTELKTLSWNKADMLVSFEKVDIQVKDILKSNWNAFTSYFTSGKNKELVENIILQSLQKLEIHDGRNTSSQKTSFFDKVNAFETSSKAKSVKTKFFAGTANENPIIEALNVACCPLVQWVNSEGRIYPQWKIYEEESQGEMLLDFRYMQGLYGREIEELEGYRMRIEEIDSVPALSKMYKHISKFQYKEFSEGLENSLKQAEINIIRLKEYRLERMKEFGIIDENATKFSKKQKLYLLEMLAIEEEVGPYIAYVKEAFKTALPIRKRVVFDSQRSIPDGVEFDPETVFDQEKWLRGNVMKAMRYEVSMGEIEQINSFCLDFSGSMHRERMRNLYKILYLLVLGLEDRKTYDSFHFFSNKFIEGINFSADYTNRSLLFGILKKVTRIQFGEFFYEGLEGTNISKGVDGCLDRLVSFRERIQAQNNSKSIVSSMFVITDGRPSLGIVNLEKLNEHLTTISDENNLSIKGIYIKDEGDPEDFISTIFGKGNFAVSSSFEEAVQQFVKIMTETYRIQRKSYKWEKKQAKLRGKV